MRASIIWIIFLCALSLSAQDSTKTRILFLMDASASMDNSWETSRKIDDAKKIISDLADSLRVVENLELGLRVYGHQSMPSAKDCKDSRMEVSFGSANYLEIFRRLSSLRPKGITPITYSLESAAEDFPKDPSGRHYIILITDGDESCEGDPCETAAMLKQKGIVLRSFVIGLGLQEETKESFKCFDDFYDATDARTFQSLLKSIVAKIVSSTSTHIDLKDVPSEPSATDFPMLFYKSRGSEPVYSFYHSLNKLGNPDTLIIDTAIYQIRIESLPPIDILDETIHYEQHNAIIESASFTGLRIDIKDKKDYDDYRIPSVIRNYSDSKILNIQELEEKVDYINQAYKIEILSQPVIQMNNQGPGRNDVNLIEISAPGELVIDKKTTVSGALFYKVDGELLLLKQLNGKSIERLELQAGEYTIIYRPKMKKSMTDSKVERVVVYPEKVSQVVLE